MFLPDICGILLKIIAIEVESKELVKVEHSKDKRIKDDD